MSSFLLSGGDAGPHTPFLRSASATAFLPPTDAWKLRARPRQPRRHSLLEVLRTPRNLQVELKSSKRPLRRSFDEFKMNSFYDFNKSQMHQRKER